MPPLPLDGRLRTARLSHSMLLRGAADKPIQVGHSPEKFVGLNQMSPHS